MISTTGHRGGGTHGHQPRPDAVADHRGTTSTHIENMNKTTTPGRFFESRSDYEKAQAAIRQGRPKPEPAKLPEAIIAKRNALFNGRLCQCGDILLVWPSSPPKGSGFVSESDARALLDGLDADKATPEQVADFLASQEGGEA